MAGPATIPLISAGLSLGSSAFGAITAGKEARRARRQEQRAKKEAKRLEEIYANLDTSNPYLNMENTMEDLTVNQQQAQFQAQQLQQSQANVLGQLRGAAGRSGIGALAQALVQQGQIGAQKASATIGAQEAANQRLAAREASRVQTLERKGEILSRNMRRDQVSTLLGMQQQRLGAARLQRAAAQRAKMQAIASGITGVTSALATGMQAGAFDKKPVTDVVEDTATNVVADTVTGKRLPLSPLLPQIQGPQTAAQAGYNEGVQGTFYNTGASYFGPNQDEYAANIYQPYFDPQPVELNQELELQPDNYLAPGDREETPFELYTNPLDPLTKQIVRPSYTAPSIPMIPSPIQQVGGVYQAQYSNPIPSLQGYTPPIPLELNQEFDTDDSYLDEQEEGQLQLYGSLGGYSPQTFTNIYGSQGINQDMLNLGF